MAGAYGRGGGGTLDSAVAGVFGGAYRVRGSAGGIGRSEAPRGSAEAMPAVRGSGGALTIHAG